MSCNIILLHNTLCNIILLRNTLCNIILLHNTLCNIILLHNTLCNIILLRNTLCNIILLHNTLCNIILLHNTLCNIILLCNTLCNIILLHNTLCNIILLHNTLCNIILLHNTSSVYLTNLCLNCLWCNMPWNKVKICSTKQECCCFCCTYLSHVITGVGFPVTLANKRNVPFSGTLSSSNRSRNRGGSGLSNGNSVIETSKLVTSVCFRI